MSRETALKGFISDKVATRTRLGEEIADHKKELAELLCPFSVGDRVTFPRKKGVYEITHILAGGFMQDYNLRGKKIKKDGFPGKVAADCGWYGTPTLVKS